MATNNPTLLERVIDKEIFEKVYKGVRTQLVGGASPFEVKRLVAEGEVAELELQGKIRDIARQLMKQMRFTEDDEDDEEIKNDTSYVMQIRKQVKDLKDKLFQDEFDQVFKSSGGPEPIIIPKTTTVKKQEPLEKQ